jgi:hypothetical protein
MTAIQFTLEAAATEAKTHFQRHNDKLISGEEGGKFVFCNYIYTKNRRELWLRLLLSKCTPGASLCNATASRECCEEEKFCPTLVRTLRKRQKIHLISELKSGNCFTSEGTEYIPGLYR